ncbi:SufE family protein [Arthrobacter sp. Br18]|uniref:SufE family protein n=1 Tax=Arthrobacter sp. Br18 TaxID=1312954 RepID=UPI0004B1B86B|nr:SufE family protein [Arthrobacter sp. Br18]
MIAFLLLLGFSNELPELPEHYENHPDLFERVEECQGAVFIFVEVDDDNVVYLDTTASSQTPSTRGFAPILAQGVDGLSAGQVLTVPDDYPQEL